MKNRPAKELSAGRGKSGTRLYPGVFRAMQEIRIYQRYTGDMREQAGGSGRYMSN